MYLKRNETKFPSKEVSVLFGILNMMESEKLLSKNWEKKTPKEKNVFMEDVLSRFPTWQGNLSSVTNTDTLKKYRLGNQKTEYELATKYLGWLPEGKKDWDEFLKPFYLSIQKDYEVTLTNPQKTESVILIMHQSLIKDAFPMEFFAEERAKDWNRFCIVSTKDNPSERFIIPLY